jgi:hypothetical protein
MYGASRSLGFCVPRASRLADHEPVPHRLSFELIQAGIWHEAPGTRDNDTDLYVLRGYINRTPDVAEGAQTE